MQSFVKGLFGPVGFIVLVQAVVLIASLLTANSMMSPFLGDNLANNNLSSQKLSSFIQQGLVATDESPEDVASEITTSRDSVQKHTPQSIFRIKEAINSDDSGQDFFSRDSFETLSNTEAQYIVQRGDTFASLWLNNGAPALGSMRALEALKSAGLPAPIMKKGESFNLVLASSGDIISLSKRAKDGSTLILTGSSISGYDAVLVKPNIIEAERSVSGAIFNSFFASAQNQDISLETIDDVVDLFSNRIEFSKSIQPGDSYTITYLEKRCKDTGEVLDVGSVVSASFKTKGKLYAAIRYKDKSGKYVYFDEKGERGGDYFLRYPVKFSRISSTFSWARFHPVLKKSRPHKGVDFAAPEGTPIRSVGDGVVEYLGYKGAPGNMLRIKHSDRWTTVYMHLQKFAPGLKQGKSISRGDLIGYVGSTGLSTGAHLHFELWENGKYVDPMAANLPSISNDTQSLPAGFLTAALKDLEGKHQQVQVALLGKDNNKPKA